jgi:hypothetical protein
MLNLASTPSGNEDLIQNGDTNQPELLPNLADIHLPGDAPVVSDGSRPYLNAESENVVFGPNA